MRIFGILLIIGGLVLLGVSYYIQGQVAAGKLQISSAQQKVDSGNQLFSLSPYTKDLGQSMTGSAQKKIDSGKQQVGYYQNLANNLEIGGYVLIVVGLIVSVLGWMQRRRR